MSCKKMKLRALRKEELMLSTEKIDQIRVREALVDLSNLFADAATVHTAQHVIEMARTGIMSATPEQMEIITRLSVSDLAPLVARAEGKTEAPKEKRPSDEIKAFGDLLQAVAANPNASERMRAKAMQMQGERAVEYAK